MPVCRICQNPGALGYGTTHLGPCDNAPLFGMRAYGFRAELHRVEGGGSAFGVAHGETTTTADVYLQSEETPTPLLRWNTHNARTQPRLQQQWQCREGHKTWTEWRDVPAVEEAPGFKTPTSSATMD